MTDPVLYISMFLGLGGVYVLISSFHDDDGGGENYINNIEYANLEGIWKIGKMIAKINKIINRLNLFLDDLLNFIVKKWTLI